MVCAHPWAGQLEGREAAACLAPGEHPLAHTQASGGMLYLLRQPHSATASPAALLLLPEEKRSQPQMAINMWISH